MNIVQFRRKRESKTDYKKRIKFLLSKKPRAAIRKSLNNISIQLITYNPKGDKIITSAHSKELKELGWKASTSNIPASYLTGLLLASKSKEKDIIIDLGLQRAIKGGRLFATVKGIVDGGIKVNISEDMFPKEDRLKGVHISSYTKECKNKNQFSKSKSDDIEKQFEAVKAKLKK